MSQSEATLQRQVAQLEQQLMLAAQHGQSLLQKNGELEDEGQKLQRANRSLEEQLSANSAKFEELHARIEELESEEEKLRNRLEDMVQEENAEYYEISEEDIEGSTQTGRRRISARPPDAADMQHTEELEHERDTLMTLNEELRAEKRAWDRERSSLMKEISALKEAEERARGEQRERRTSQTLGKFKAQVELNKFRVREAELINENAELKETISKLERDKKCALTGAVEVRKSFEELIVRFTQMQHKYEYHLVLLDREHVRCLNLEQKVQELNETLETARFNRDESGTLGNEFYQLTLASVEEQRAESLANELSDLSASMSDAVQQMIDSTTEDLEVLKAQLAEAKQKAILMAERFKAEFEILEADNDDLRATCEEANWTVAQLESELEQVRFQLENSKAEQRLQDELREILAKGDAEREVAAADVRRLQADILELKALSDSERFAAFTESQRLLSELLEVRAQGDAECTAKAADVERLQAELSRVQTQAALRAEELEADLLRAKDDLAKASAAHEEALALSEAARREHSDALRSEVAEAASALAATRAAREALEQACEQALQAARAAEMARQQERARAEEERARAEEAEETLRSENLVLRVRQEVAELAVAQEQDDKEEARMLLHEQLQRVAAQEEELRRKEAAEAALKDEKERLLAKAAAAEVATKSEQERLLAKAAAAFDEAVAALVQQLLAAVGLRPVKLQVLRDSKGPDGTASALVHLPSKHDAAATIAALGGFAIPLAGPLVAPRRRPSLVYGAGNYATSKVAWVSAEAETARTHRGGAYGWDASRILTVRHEPDFGLVPFDSLRFEGLPPAGLVDQRALQPLLRDMGQKGVAEQLQAEVEHLREQLLAAQDQQDALQTMLKRKDALADTITEMQRDMKQLRLQKERAEAAEKSAYASLLGKESEMLRTMAAARHLEHEFAVYVN